MSSDYIVGIDLGTTNSLVAYMQGDSPVVIPGEDGLNLVPSVVALDKNNQIVVGNAARRYLIETPERAVYSIKRLMGRGLEDIQDELKLFPFQLAEDLQPGEVLRIKIGERTYTPPEISALVLRQLKRNAERFFRSARNPGGHHRSRILQRRAAAGDERCRPHCRTECSAAGE
jgi:molecular chaperone DnaK